MGKWDIQQRIWNLESRKNDLETEISRLEGKKNRILLEYKKKTRQQSQINEFYLNRRQNALKMKEVAQGKGINKILDAYLSNFDVTKENCLVGDLSNVKTYLSKNCEKIDDMIEDYRGQILSINWQIYQCEQDLKEIESEVQ